MLLKIRGYELEILQGKFVCFARDNGETNYFSEWRHLDPELRKKFETIREQLLEVMEDFVNSKDNDLFEAISEEYRKKEQPPCTIKKPGAGSSS
jgi:hypothetical protein